MTGFGSVVENRGLERSDEDLLADLQRGEPQPAGVLYDRHHQALYAYALTLVRDPGLAEDVVHETFLRVLAFRPEVPVASAKAFFHTIARNLSLDLIRSTTRQGDHRLPLAQAM